MSIGKLFKNLRTGEHDIIKYSSYTEPYEGDKAGDFSGILKLDDGRTLFYIGDVTGHDEVAAKKAEDFTYLINYVVKSKKDVKTSDIAKELNNFACLIDNINDGDYMLDKSAAEQARAKIKSFVYATAFFAIYDPKSHAIDYTLAGHHPTIYFPDMYKPEKSLELHSPDFMLGMLSGHDYKDQIMPLKKNSLFFMTTDGIIEREDEQHKSQYGNQRVVDILKKNLPSPEHLLVERVYLDAHRFGGFGTKFADDVSILALTINK